MLSRLWLVLFILSLLALPAHAQMRKAEYLHYIKLAAARGWAENQSVIDTWKKTTKPSELWGYDAPAGPIYLADTLGYLYQETKERAYAEKARDILATYGDLRQIIPPDYPNKRIEYRNGVPSLSNFFIMPPYARAYMRIRESGVMDAATRAKVERELAFSLDYIFYYPEWGAHNRAMLRAESLYYGAIALGGHPNAARWRQLAETLASDSLKGWEIEDATHYNGIWLYSVFSYCEIAGREDVLRSPIIRYYLDYFMQLLTPHGNLPDFGDAHWTTGGERFVPVFEKAATLFRDPRYKYFAEQMARRWLDRQARAAKTDVNTLAISTGVASPWADAHAWADDSIKPEAPTDLSREVLEDVIGKKVVFRNGWNPASTYLLLNYRDEGDAGLLGRDFLRQTLSVEEEKMHHGHADENSIALLMSGGAVLLHDGGYRPDLPSGPFGAWRADYFHNRIVARKNRRDKNQDVFEFLRNSGAYRRVRTQKVDFLNCKDADVSRTRVIDEELGYQTDRIITYFKRGDFFVVIDAIKVLRPDYFTFTNLWHTRQLLGRTGNTFETAYDKIQTDLLPANKQLAIAFPDNSPGKPLGTFPISRHFQDETAIYQTVSSFYHAGDTESFATLLLPHDRAAGSRVTAKLMAADRAGKGIGLTITDGAETFTLCVKLDLDLDLGRGDTGPRYSYDLGKIRYGEFETDASFLLAQVKGAEVSYSAATMTRILYRTQTLMEALPNTFGLQPDGAPPRIGFAKWRFWEETVKLK